MSKEIIMFSDIELKNINFIIISQVFSQVVDIGSILLSIPLVKTVTSAFLVTKMMIKKLSHYV